MSRPAGPYFRADVFVSTNTPDDHAAFAKGQLGILQSGFDSNEYAVAYRYLNGGKLSDAERDAYAPPINQPQPVADYRNFTPEQIAAAQEAEKQAQENNQPFGRWLRARAKFIPEGTPGEQKPVFPTDYDGNIVPRRGLSELPRSRIHECNAHTCRIEPTPGANKARPSRLDSRPGCCLFQLRRQDRCHARACVSQQPRPASKPIAPIRSPPRPSTQSSSTKPPANSPPSPPTATPRGAPGARYLAARATVRKAFAMGKATDPYSGDLASYDNGTMQRAQQMLESLLKQPNPKPSRTIIQDELNFIRIRTEPEKRAAEICTALAGPAPDPNFTQDMRDLSWTL